MTVGMIPDFFIRHDTGNPLAVFIHHHRRNAENEPTVPVGGLQLLNRVASGAGEAIFVEAAIHLGILGQASGEYRDGVVAAIAVTRELDPLRAQQNIYAGAIEGCAKRIRMQRVAPLAVSLRVASTAVFGVRKRRGWNEIVAFDGQQSGVEILSFPKRKL